MNEEEDTDNESVPSWLFNDDQEELEEEVSLPENIFNEEEYLARAVNHYDTTYNEMIETIEEYLTLSSEDARWDYNEQLFQVNVVYLVNGNVRNHVYRRITFSSLLEEIYKLIQNMEEKYSIEDFGEIHKIVNWYYRPINPWYGFGQENFIFKIVNNICYSIYFDKTKVNCLVLSVLKYLGIIEKNAKIKDIEKHTLITHASRFNEDSTNHIKYLERYFNKRIVIANSSHDLSKYPNKPKDIILLYSVGPHIGYVEWGLPKLKSLEFKEKKNKKREDISTVLVYDCEFSFLKRMETEGEVLQSNDPKLICCCYESKSGYKERVFDSFYKFMKFLQILSQNGKVISYSHNGSSVEHLFIVKELVNRFKQGDKLGYYSLDNVIGNKVKTLTFGDILFIDSLLFIKNSVSNIAKTFNTTVEKGHASWEKENKDYRYWENGEWKYKLDLDKWYANKEWSINNPDDVEYCMNDCRIIFQALNKFNDKLLEIIPQEVPRCSFNGKEWLLDRWSISSLGKEVLLNEHPEIVNDSLQAGLFANSYFGGRCEAFKLGYIYPNKEQKLGMIDIKSSYPSQKSKLIAGKYYKTVKTIPKDTSLIWLGLFSFRYKEKYNIPPLAYQSKGRLIFPNFDNYVTHWIWSFEYQELKNNLDIQEIKNIYCFQSITFKDIIEPWYQEKEKCGDSGDLAGKEIYKILLNGSSGGLGINPLRDVRTITNNSQKFADSLKLQEYTYFNAFDDKEWVLHSNLCDVTCAFQTISCITAMARIQLWKKAMKMESLGCIILYFDTDSIFALVPKNYVWDNSKELGEWDYEEYEAGFIRGCKMYAFDKKVRFKGINQELLKEMSMLHILDDIVVKKNKRWMRTRNNDITIKDLICEYSSPYCKGRVKENGNIEPLNV